MENKKERALIDTVPEQYKNKDIHKMSKMPLHEIIDDFYDLQYPASTWYYHNIIGIGREEELGIKSRLRFLKHLCINDLYYFTKYLLKKNKLREKPNRLMAEKFMIRLRPDEQEWKLICEPRGTYKSTLSMGFAIQQLCRRPNISIQIDSETDKQAHDIYKAIRDEMEFNILLKEIFGDFKTDRWNETSLNIKQRNFIRRDPSLFHSGVDSSINGLHPDIALIDDPCSEENTQSKESIDKVEDHLRLFTPLVDKTGQIIFILTRWVQDDITGRILSNKEKREQFSVLSIKSCYGENGDGKSIKDGLYAPEILSEKYLERAKATMGMYRFSANYINDPTPSEDMSFKIKWLKYYEGDEPLEMDEDGSVKKIPLSVYIGIDASWADKSSNTGRDPTAIAIIGFDCNGNVYLLDYMVQRISPTEVIDKLFQYVSIYNPENVATEDIGTQKGLNLQIEQEMHKREVYFPITRVKHQARSKESRILSLTPIFEKGCFYLKEGMDDFIEQYKYFSPSAKIAHDDLLDAIEMVISEFRQIYKQPTKEYEEQSYDEEFTIYDPRTGRM